MSDSDITLARDISREALIEELRALRPALEAQAVTRVALVGSRARGDHRVDSDVDLLIDVDPKRKFSLIEVARIVRIVEDRVGLRAQILMRRSLSPRMQNVIQDQRLVF